METDMTALIARRTIIVRSRSTGKYHLGTAGSEATIWCNYSGQRRIPNVTAAQRGEVEKAGAQMFCAKCFNGKPDANRYFCD
jgi:hypothetical protein